MLALTNTQETILVVLAVIALLIIILRGRL
jgi:hypothetical protein